jgi:hypothetical protein
MKEAITVLKNARRDTSDYEDIAKKLDTLQENKKEIIRLLKDKFFPYPGREMESLHECRIIELYKSLIIESDELLYKNFLKNIQEEIRAESCQLLHRIEGKIKKEESKQLPSIETLLKLYEKYSYLEEYFEIFSIDPEWKYAAKTEELSKLWQSLKHDLPEIEHKMSSIDKKTEPLEKMIAAYNLQSVIDDAINRHKIKYLETEVDVRSLEDKGRIVSLVIDEQLQLLLKDYQIDDLPVNGLTMKDRYVLVRSKVFQLREITGKIPAASERLNVVKRIISDYRDKALDILKKMKDEPENFDSYDEYVDLLKFKKNGFQELGDQTTSETYGAKVNSLDKEMRSFTEEFHILENTMTKTKGDDSDNAVAMLTLISSCESFLQRFKNSSVSKTMPHKSNYAKIEAFHTDRKGKYDEYLSKAAIKQNLVLYHVDTGTQYTFLYQDRVCIGRDDECIQNDINIPIRAVSRKHLELDFYNGLFRDRGSSYGTFVNEDGKIKVIELPLEEVKEFNLALSVTFTITSIPHHFTMIRFKRITNSKVSYIGEQTPEFWVKSMKKNVFLKIFTGIPVYFDKRNGMIAQSAFNDVDYIELEYRNGLFYLTDRSEKMLSMPLLKNNTRIAGFYIEGD